MSTAAWPEDRWGRCHPANAEHAAQDRPRKKQEPPQEPHRDLLPARPTDGPEPLNLPCRRHVLRMLSCPPNTRDKLRSSEVCRASSASSLCYAALPLSIARQRDFHVAASEDRDGSLSLTATPPTIRWPWARGLQPAMMKLLLFRRVGCEANCPPRVPQCPLMNRGDRSGAQTGRQPEEQARRQQEPATTPPAMNTRAPVATSRAARIWRPNPSIRSVHLHGPSALWRKALLTMARLRPKRVPVSS